MVKHLPGALKISAITILALSGISNARAQQTRPAGNSSVTSDPPASVSQFQRQVSATLSSEPASLPVVMRPAAPSAVGPAGVSAGVVLWLDGSNVNNTSPSTNPANNTLITTWKDVSGNGNDATVLGGQNAGKMNTAGINSSAAVTFTRISGNSGSVYNVPGVDIRSANLKKMTIFTMYRPGTRDRIGQALWGDDNGGYDRFLYSSYAIGAGGLSEGNTLSQPIIYLTNTHIPGLSKLVTAVYDSGVVNGSSVYINGDRKNIFTDSTGATAAQSTFRLGWDGNDGNFNGDIAEVIIYNRVLTDCEMKSVNRYLAKKYGLSFTTANIIGADTINTVLCTGTPITLAASAGTSYQWLNNNAPIGAATNSTYTTAAAGNYSVVVTTNGCPDTSAVTPVSLVTIATSAQILYSPDTLALCGDSVQLNVIPNHVNGKDILSATLPSNNSREGQMFDLYADNPVTIQGFDINIDANPSVYSVYTRAGSFTGFELSEAGWTLLTSFTITGNGVGTPTRIPVKLNQPIAAGQIQSFYITNELYNSVVGYRNGTAQGAVWVQDNNLRLLQGVGINNIFTGGGNIFSPRCLVGNIHYQGWPLPTWNTGDWNDTIKVYPPVTTDYMVQLGWTQSGCFARDTQRVVRVRDTIYVDGTMPVTGNGASWASPYKTLTEALYYANKKYCPTQIWVKKGTYLPMKDLTTVATSRDSAFRILRNGIKLYGGFAGTETSLIQRNIAANPTILSGDIGVLNDSLDNVSHVLTIVSQPTDNITTATVVSGFTITKANANIVSTTTVNGIFSQRGDGGGIALIGSGTGNNCSPKIDSCTIVNNYANVGGALYCGAYNAGSCSPVINDCVIKNNNAINVGGIHAYGSGGVTSPILTRCIFSNNTTLNFGGAIGLFNANAAGTVTPQAINCIFSGNTAATTGGVLNIFNGPGTYTLTNCVFTNNSTTGATSGGGVIHVPANGTAVFNDCTINNNTTGSTANPNSNAVLNDAGGTITLNNSIIWGTAAAQIVNNGTANYNYSDIKGIAPAGTNLSINPEFINPANPIGPDNIWATADDGLNLVVCAPVTNKGSNALIPAGITTDVKNTARIQQTTVDMGAYESSLTTLIAYVDGTVAVNGNGTSWASPFKTLTQALNVANFTNCVSEIWVKKGTYYPMADLTTIATSRDSSFRILRNGIKVYGGFAGTETLLTQRNVVANPTILSGDIGVIGSATDNIYHVFTIVSNSTNNINNTTTVDGFTIRDAANNGAGSITVNGTLINQSDGGGMLLAGNGAGNNCSPLIQNNTYTNNAGTFGAGLYCLSTGGGVSSPAITNCSFISNSAAGGGAMSAYGSNSSPTVTGCTFTNNAASSKGGALDMNGTAGVCSPIFTSCTFTGNTAVANAGAASNTGVAATPSSPQYVNCTFSANRAGTQGGGIYANTVQLTVAGSTLKNNVSAGGGGLYQITGTLTLTNDSLNYNYGAQNGGGAFIDGVSGTFTNIVCLGDTAGFGGGMMMQGAGTINITKSNFLNNRAGFNTNSGGAGLNNNGINLTASYCVFAGNTAQAPTGTNGSGAGFQQGLTGTANLNNCVFANNAALGANDDGGGAIMNYGGTINIADGTFSENTTASTTKPNANTISTVAATTTLLNNSIIWGAAANHVQNLGTFTSNYSDVKGIPAAGTNLSTDPFFINAADADGADNLWGTADDGLKLIDCSKAINTGSNALIPAGITTDITTGPRIIQAIVDMGAYENTYVLPPSQSVTIVASQNPACAGASVTFTATPVNGGATPAYQWQVNGVNAGTNAPTFTSTTLANNDVVTVIMTSSLQCVLPPTITSNSITMTINPNLTPSVSITASQSTICANASVTFTATPVNGGTAPAYQWQVNGVNAGTNSPTFTSATLANNDVVTVIMTSNYPCALSNNPVSNSITMTVGTNLTPSVSIAITTGAQTICAGTSVTFTATPTNGGTAPSYQWQVNAVNAGTNASTFTSTTLANGDIVRVIMTSNAGCLASNNPTSNTITMTVNPNLTPSVSIAITSGAQTICAGTSVTFTATPANGGTTPIYQWQVNGVNAGTNAPTFTSTTLANGDIVKVIMTSNFGCLASNNPSSNTITMTVNPNLTPAVSIAITNGAQTICAGTSVTFTATPTNGGTTPVYQWQVNGVNAGTNAPTFTSTTLANGDIVKVIMTSNFGCLASNNPVSNMITMTVNTNLTPTASIAITNGAQTICAGTSVTFTATITNGGTAPVYQWQVNGVNAGTNAATFTSTTLANGDIVKVILTSNETCLATNNVSSNTITMTVNPNITTSVSIAITNGAQTICAGTSVTFTATQTNGGTAPAYQWKVNGINAGTNAPTFTSTTLANGDVVTVVLTSNETCLASNNPTSNSITMTVNPNLTPAVSIAITNGAQTICAGTSVTFTATPANGGTAPAYQWKVNGVNAGTNAPTFTSNTLANADVVTVVLTSNEACLASNNPTSNSITMTVNPNLTPTVSIAITNGAQTICAGTSVTFTATITNGGTTPAYQWKVNGVNAGTNAATFTSATLANNDVVTVVLTSNETCLATNNVVSNSITMTVNPNLTPKVSITASQTTICQGASITFTATITNGGTAPFYQWKINGSNAGSNSPTFSVSTLANNDIVTVVLTSNETCLATNNVVSNGITITVNPNLTPTISIAIPSSTVCAGAFAQFTATITNGGPTPHYQWKVNNVNAGTNSPTFASATLASGDIVSCILTTSIPCYTALNVASNNIVITIAPNPVVTLTGVTEILQGGYAQLNSSVSVANVTYNWTPSASLDNASGANPIASPDNTTLYKLVATSPAGCTGSATISVRVVPGPQIANTFTPNNDGIHDFWEIKNLFTYPDCRIQVFTRTGQLVFESVGYKKPWDGNYKGKPLPFDTYYYILELNNRIATKPITGYVTIVK